MKILKPINDRILKWAVKSDDDPRWKLYEKILLILEGLAIAIPIIIFSWHFVYQEPPQPQQPEPLVYIIKARIENLPINYSGQSYDMKFNEENKIYQYQSRVQLHNICGDMSLINTLVPVDSPLIRKYNKDFLRVGQGLTYSISTFTEKREGKVTLKIYSRDTNFSVERQVASIKKIGESKGLVGLYEEIWETDLSLHSQGYENLLELVPDKDRKIKIECIGIKNCEVTEIKYVISNFNWNMTDGGKLEMKGINTSGKTHKIEVLLPQPNPNETSIYEFDESINEFLKISLDNPTNATSTIFIKSPCNREGKIYIHPLGT